MGPYYDYLTEKLKWPVDDALRQRLKDVNTAALEKFDADQRNAEEQETESETRDITENRANYYTLIGDKVRLAVHLFLFTKQLRRLHWRRSPRPM